MSHPIELRDYQRPLRLNVDEFFRLAEAGAFARYKRTELIEGEVLTTSSQWMPHARATAGLTVELTIVAEAMGLMLSVVAAPSVRIEPDSAPEPDVLLTSYKGDKAVPVATVSLAVEVSASTLEFDLGRKLRLYAAAGIPEYWVVDIENRLVRQFWAPAGQGYAERRETPFGQPVAAETIAGLVVPTTRLPA